MLTLCCETLPGMSKLLLNSLVWLLCSRSWHVPGSQSGKHTSRIRHELGPQDVKSWKVECVSFRTYTSHL